MIKVAPSILSADFAAMGQACQKLEQAGADYIHCDVMDGGFVHQITFGNKMVSACKHYTQLPMDVHLMINNPMEHVETFYEAGADIITVHFEAEQTRLFEIIHKVKSLGAKCGLSINPATPVSVLEPYLSQIDLVLIMSVVPGWAGQSFMPEVLSKIEFCSQYARKNDRDLLIEVDGGINGQTASLCADAGANMLVAGSYIFGAKDMRKAIEGLQTL